MFFRILISHLILDRKNSASDENPFIFNSDSQSVKLSPLISGNRGLDANKKVNGSKRQLLVDNGGRLWFANVHAANYPDGAAALVFLPDIICQDERLTKIYGDQAYNGVLAKGVEKFGIEFEKAAKPESTRGFVSVAKRWPGRRAVAERAIAWSNRRATPFFGRIVKDYEFTIYSSVNWLYLANIQMMLQRIQKTNQT